MNTIKVIIFSIPVILLFFTLNTLSEPEEINEEDHYVPGSKKALEFWTRSRAYPQNDIPAEKFYTEFEKTKIVSKNAKKNGMIQASWEEIGPYNVPGRMISGSVNTG